MLRTSYDANKKIWSGPAITPIFNPKTSIGSVVLEALTNFGPKKAQISIDSGTQMTFDEIRLKTIRAAQNLQKRGYNTKQMFGLIARNSLHVTPIVFASMCLGCPINLMEAAFGKIELFQMLKTTAPILIFCDIEAYDMTIECLKELENNAMVFTFGGSKDASEPVENLFVPTGIEEEFLPVEVDGETEIAAILCSSGTTGFPKCISLSHAATLDHTLKVSEVFYDDVMFTFSQLFWICGYHFLFTSILHGATQIITTQDYSAELQLRLIKKYQISYLMNPTTYMIGMMKCDGFSASVMSSIKVYTATGSPIPSHIREEMQSYLMNGELYIRYGLSELTAISNYFHNKDQNGKDSVGQLVQGVEIKIVDNSGNKCGVNQDGEICAKMRCKFLGYYGNQQATDACYDNEGFFCTGDIGHFDENGYLYVNDRKNDMLSCNEIWVSSSAIESELMKMPGIESVCVVGIPEIGNDLPAAIVVRNSNITEKQVVDFVRDHFSEYCELRGGVYFVESIPKTSTGKLQRRTVKEMAVKLYNSA